MKEISFGGPQGYTVVRIAIVRMLVAVIPVLSWMGCNDRASKTLSRSAALGILNEQKEKVLGLENYKLELLDSNPFFIGRGLTNEDEIVGRVPLVLPTLEFLKQRGIPDDRFVLGHFYNKLVRERFIFKQKSLKNDTVFGEVGLVIEYEELPRHDVVWERAGRRSVSVKSVTGSFKEVTGISQEGNSAKVEARFEMQPTEDVVRLKELAEATLRDLNVDPNSYLGRCNGPIFNPMLCRFLRLESRRNDTASYYMKLYDDGWRVER